MNTRTQILDLLGDYVDMPVDQIDTSLGLKFTGIDSFVMMSFIGAIEDHFGIKIPNESLLQMTTLDDIISFVENVRPAIAS